MTAQRVGAVRGRHTTDGEDCMEINGILSGLTPKVAKAGRDIEMKITIAFNPATMAALANWFNEPVLLDIMSDVQELEERPPGVTDFDARRT